MKSVVNFLSLGKNQDINQSICSLTRDLYKSGSQIIIIDTDSNLEKLDKLLWTFEQNSFLPHKIYKPNIELDTPIILLSKKYLNNLLVFNMYNSIINNFDKPILAADESTEVYELVENYEDKKVISRNKYLAYKRNNFSLSHNKYHEQTI